MALGYQVRSSRLMRVFRILWQQHLIEVTNGNTHGLVAHDSLLLYKSDDQVEDKLMHIQL